MIKISVLLSIPSGSPGGGKMQFCCMSYGTGGPWFLLKYCMLDWSHIRYTSDLTIPATMQSTFCRMLPAGQALPWLWTRIHHVRGKNLWKPIPIHLDVI